MTDFTDRRLHHLRTALGQCCWNLPKKAKVRIIAMEAQIEAWAGSTLHAGRRKFTSRIA